LLYSPTINALEHDRIAIEQQVERENPHGLREPPDSQTEQRDEEDQHECRAVAHLGALSRELGAIQKFLAVLWLWGRLKAVQQGPYAGRNDSFDQPDSGPSVKHWLDWSNGHEKARQVQSASHKRK